MPGDFDHVIILTSSTQLIALVYNMDECRFCGKAEFNAIFLRLRWKLEDFDQIAGWGPVWAYNIQPGLLDLMLLTDSMFR